VLTDPLHISDLLGCIHRKDHTVIRLDQDAILYSYTKVMEMGGEGGVWRNVDSRLDSEDHTRPEAPTSIICGFVEIYANGMAEEMRI